MKFVKENKFLKCCHLPNETEINDTDVNNISLSYKFIICLYCSKISCKIIPTNVCCGNMLIIIKSKLKVLYLLTV